jgi:hypothetical protein
VTRWLTLHLVVLALTLGCPEQGGGGTVVPHGGGTDSGLRPDGDPEGESMAELDLRLDKLVAERASLTSVTDDASKCEELCELSRAICEVKTKMCSIAESQVTDEDYQNLCRKAKQRCSDASDSCVRCVERNEGRGGASCEAEPGESK